MFIQLFQLLQAAVEDKDELKIRFIITRLADEGFPVERLSYCFYENSFIFNVEDSSDTGRWLETTTYYDSVTCETYEIAVDQDGGEQLEVVGTGVVF